MNIAIRNSFKHLIENNLSINIIQNFKGSSNLCLHILYNYSSDILYNYSMDYHMDDMQIYFLFKRSILYAYVISIGSSLIVPLIKSSIQRDDINDNCEILTQRMLQNVNNI